MSEVYTFHIDGLHCQACKLLTEAEVKSMAGVVTVKTSLKENCIEIYGDFQNKGKEEVMNQANEILKPHGYVLMLEKQNKKTNWSEFMYAVPIALIFIMLFFLLQKSGIGNVMNISNMTYGTAFIIGLIASISTCMAVVGGIVLSLSANFAKQGERILPQIRFHVGRLLSFFVLGGSIGVLGSIVQFDATSSFILGILIALVLLILGINLLDIIPWLKNIRLSLPSFVGKKVQSMKKMNNSVTPFLVGTLTFFLPCGFTQSMQFYTLSTGDFVKGGLTMLMFALGTLPVLALLSFGSLGIQKKAQSGIFFKTAGLIVIFFAMFNLMNTLAAAGIIEPVFTF